MQREARRTEAFAPASQSRMPEAVAEPGAELLGGASETGPRAAGHGSRARTGLATVATAAGLLGAPAAAYFGLQLRVMSYVQSIDPFLSTAYAVNGPDLIHRFGTDEYYWTRVGFSIPAHLLGALFGATGGFFAFRYVLALIAIVPIYVLLRRLRGPAAGWIGVSAVLVSPVVITGWSTDYPTSAAISYLTAGAAFLFIPAASVRARAMLGAVAGVWFGIAIGSGLVAAVVVVGAVAGRIIASPRAEWRTTIRELASVAAGVIVSFVLVALAARLYLGNADIITPQLQALHRFGEPVYRSSFHSSTWRWLIDDVYVLAPLAVLGAWAAAAWPFNARTSSRTEIGFAAAMAVTYVLFTFYQFVLGSWTLEYWLYTDMLWALAVPLLVITALRIAGSAWALGRLQTMVVGVAILLVPVLLRILRDHLHLSLKLAVAITVLPALTVVVARMRPRPAARLGGAVVTIAASALLVAGQPAFTLYPGQAPYVTPDLGTALYGSSQQAQALDEYAVTTRLHTVVPSAAALPGGLAMWLPPQSSHLVLISSAQYLFLPNALPDSLPQLTSSSFSLLQSRHIRVLVLLSDTGDEFAAARAALGAAPFSYRTVSDTVLHSGSARLHVDVLELIPRSSAGPGS